MWLYIYCFLSALAVITWKNVYKTHKKISKLTCRHISPLFDDIEWLMRDIFFWYPSRLQRFKLTYISVDKTLIAWVSHCEISWQVPLFRRQLKWKDRQKNSIRGIQNHSVIAKVLNHRFIQPSLRFTFAKLSKDYKKVLSFWPIPIFNTSTRNFVVQNAINNQNYFVHVFYSVSKLSCVRFYHKPGRSKFRKFLFFQF